MTTTLISAGGNSLTTDETGPSLEIKGLTGAVGTNVDSTSTTLSSSLKRMKQIQVFSDDFCYHTDNTVLNLSWASNPLQESNIWQVTGITGYGAAMTDVSQGAVSFSGKGTLLFTNQWQDDFQPYYAGWSLSAPNAAFGVNTNLVTYESRVYIYTPVPYPYNPSANTWALSFGLLDNYSRFMGFSFTTITNKPAIYFNGTAHYPASYLFASNYLDCWITLKMILNSSTGLQVFIITVEGGSQYTYNLSASVDQPLSCIPYMYVGRTGDYIQRFSDFTFVLDNVEVVSELPRYA